MQDYVVIDLEMTGLNPKRDAVLEVGAVRVRGKRVEDVLEFFVNPMRPLTTEVVELTGITQEMADGGILPQETIRRVASFVGDDIWVGHNVIFDYSFLKQLAVNERIPFEKRAVDTLKAARGLPLSPGKKSLGELCECYRISRGRAHRALDDALATMQLYEILEQKYGRDYKEIFSPKPLLYKPKRETPATPVQKKHLKELLNYHKIDEDILFETLTRSEASRKIDKILSQFGRIPNKTG